MNEEYLKILIPFILQKSDPILDELKKTLTELRVPMYEVQMVAIDNALKGAVITGMKGTIERFYADDKIK